MEPSTGVPVVAQADQRGPDRQAGDEGARAVDRDRAPRRTRRPAGPRHIPRRSPRGRDSAAEIRLRMARSAPLSASVTGSKPCRSALVDQAVVGAEQRQDRRGRRAGSARPGRRRAQRAAREKAVRVGAVMRPLYPLARLQGNACLDNFRLGLVQGLGQIEQALTGPFAEAVEGLDQILGLLAGASGSGGSGSRSIARCPGQGPRRSSSPAPPAPRRAATGGPPTCGWRRTRTSGSAGSARRKRRRAAAGSGPGSGGDGEADDPDEYRSDPS